LTDKVRVPAMRLLLAAAILAAETSAFGGARVACERGALMFGSKIVSKIVISILVPYSSDGFIKSAAPRTTVTACRVPHPSSKKPQTQLV